MTSMTKWKRSRSFNTVISKGVVMVPSSLLLYLVLLIGRNLVWPRRIVATAVVAFMVATWIYFALMPLVPLVGHVLWIVGALMILAGEVIEIGRASCRERV